MKKPVETCMYYNLAHALWWNPAFYETAWTIRTQASDFANDLSQDEILKKYDDIRKKNCCENSKNCNESDFLTWFLHLTWHCLRD